MNHWWGVFIALERSDLVYIPGEMFRPQYGVYINIDAVVQIFKEVSERIQLVIIVSQVVLANPDSLFGL